MLTWEKFLRMQQRLKILKRDDFQLSDTLKEYMASWLNSSRSSKSPNTWDHLASLTQIAVQ